MAVSVISLKTIRFVLVIGNLNISQICQEIASPSRSSSDANNTSFAFCIILRILSICFNLSLHSLKVGLKLLFISIESNPDNSRK